MSVTTPTLYLAAYFREGEVTSSAISIITADFIHDLIKELQRHDPSLDISWGTIEAIRTPVGATARMPFASQELAEANLVLVVRVPGNSKVLAAQDELEPTIARMLSEALTPTSKIHVVVTA